MKIEEAASSGEWGDVGGAVQVKAEERDDPTAAPFPPPSRSLWNSPTPSVKDKMRSTSSSPNESEREEIVGGDITLKMEPGKAPKLARTAAQKVVAKPPPLYLDLPDVSESAKETFVVIPECTYANKSLGTTDRALECDCSEEWGKWFFFSARPLSDNNMLISSSRPRVANQQCLR
jgi:histone-lysine N-methyltransferase SETD2